MTKAIRFDRTGGPEVMKWVDVDVGKPGEGEIRIRQHAVGLNYIDVYFRTGLYPLPLPGGLGMEAAGEVTEVGAGVTDVKVGERVAYVARPPGAYAQERVLCADQLIRLPDAISDEAAASIMLQGLTAQYLLRRTYRVQAGDTIVIHAAAGGLGFSFSAGALGVVTGGAIWSCAAAGAVSSSVARMVMRGSFMSGASRARRSQDFGPQAQSRRPS